MTNGLVDFVIGGAAKSGTASLYNYFDAHPKVCMSRLKEPNYFSMHYDKGSDWYEEKYNHCRETRIRGEASISYLEFAERTAPRLCQDVPGVQLLFVLRDPVERAWSDYWYSVRQGRIEHRDGLFGDLIRGEVSVPSYHHPERDTGELILRKGKYYDALTTYYEYFDSDQIKVLLTKDLSEEAFKEACTFLDIQPASEGRKRKDNTGKYPANRIVYRLYRAAGTAAREVLSERVHQQLSGIKESIAAWVFQQEERPPMNPSDRQYLRELYREQNRGLEELLGRDLSEWSQTE